MTEGGKPLDPNENVDVAMKVAAGKVLMSWQGPREHIFFEAQAAFNFAEHTARAAHRARFPEDKMPEDFSYLAQQIKQRLTDEMRDRLVIRVRTSLPSLLQNKDLNYVARQVVDTIFAALDDQGYYKL